MPRRPTNLFERRGVYYGRYKDGAGTWRQKALGRHLHSAKSMLAELQRNCDMERAGLGALTKQNRTLSSLVEPYLADLAVRASPKHVYNTRIELAAVLQLAKVDKVSAMKPEVAMRMQRELLEKLAHRTVDIKIGHLKAMLQWAVENEIIAVNPLMHLKKVTNDESKARRNRARLTAEEVHRLITAADAWDAAAYRVKGRRRLHVPQAPLIATMLGTGFRFSEATTLVWGDVRKSDGTTWLTVRLERSKNRVARSNPVSNDIERRLTALRTFQSELFGREMTQLDLVFLSWTGRPFRGTANSARKWLREIVRLAKLDKRSDGRVVDWHSLRHTYCTLLAESGVDLRVNAALMGHESIELTRKAYTDSDRLPKISALSSLAAILAPKTIKVAAPEGARG